MVKNVFMILLLRALAVHVRHHLVEEIEVADFGVEIGPQGHRLFFPNVFVFGLVEDFDAGLLHGGLQAVFHGDDHFAVVLGGEASAFEDGLLDIGGLLLEPCVVDDHDDDLELVAQLGHVLLHFFKLVGRKDHVGVFLAVDDLLLEGVECFVPREGGRLTAPCAERVDHDRVVGHADFEALEVFDGADGMLAVADVAVAEVEPADDAVAAFLDGLGVELVPILVEDVPAFLVGPEQIGEIDDIEGRGEHGGIIGSQGCYLDDALLHVLKGAFLAAELAGGVDLYFHSALGFLFNVFLEVQSRRVMRLLHHGRRTVAVAHDDFLFGRRLRGQAQDRPDHQSYRCLPCVGQLHNALLLGVIWLGLRPFGMPYMLQGRGHEA